MESPFGVEDAVLGRFESVVSKLALACAFISNFAFLTTLKCVKFPDSALTAVSAGVPLDR